MSSMVTFLVLTDINSDWDNLVQIIEILLICFIYHSLIFYNYL